MLSPLTRAISAVVITLILAAGAVSYADGPLPPTAPLWSFKTENSRPAQFGMVDAGQLYCSSYNGHVYRIDLASGVLQNDWNVCAGIARAYSAPLMIGGELFVYTGDKGFYRLDKTPTPTAVKLADVSPGSTNGIRVEALAYDPGTKLFFLGNGNVVNAVDRTGAVKWTLPHANAEWGEPMACDGMLYTYDTNNSAIYKYNPAAPAAGWLWQVPFGGTPATTTYLSKGVDGNGDMLIFAVGWEGDAASMGTIAAIYDDGPLAGTKKWEVPLDHTIKHASLWEGHDTLVIPAMNGKVEWRRASTGQLLREATLSEGVAPGQDSPWQQVVISGDYGIVGTHDATSATADNYVFVLDLNTGKELWRSDPTVGGGGCMIPVLSDGIVVYGTYYGSTSWFAYDLGDGLAVSFSRFANERNTGNVSGGLTNLVPEPATMVLLTLAAPLLLCRRRKGSLAEVRH